MLGGWRTLHDSTLKQPPRTAANLPPLYPVSVLLFQLTMAKPKEIPALLPGLLSCIRMIWNLSKFYNTEERLTGLLRKISNEVGLPCTIAGLTRAKGCLYSSSSIPSGRRPQLRATIRLRGSPS